MNGEYEWLLSHSLKSYTNSCNHCLEKLNGIFLVFILFIRIKKVCEPSKVFAC